MFKRRCALNKGSAPISANTQGGSFREKIFYFIGPLILMCQLFSVSHPLAGERVPTASDKPDAGSFETRVASDSLPLYPRKTDQIIVNITVNLESRGDFFVEFDDEPNLLLRTEDLDTLMLKYDELRAVLINEERHIPLSAVQDVKSSFDQQKLILGFIGKTTQSEKTFAEIFPLHTSPKNVYLPRETSAFLNYGITYARDNQVGFQSLSATNKLGARAGDVFFVSDSLYSKTERQEEFVRLQSSITYERRNDMKWIVLGDQYASSGELGSAVNLGGVGFSKVYKLDPYFITQQVYNLQGAAIYPSEAEIYLDGVLVGKQKIVPGTFDFRNIFSYNGAHRIEVALKDPFGNEQRYSYPAYFNTLMLREGLHEYSYNAGFLRQRYGVESDEYGKPVFSAFHRYGLTNSVNVGARAEASDGIYNGGVSVSLVSPLAGTVGLSLAASKKDGSEGSAGSIQHSFQVGSFNTNLSARAFSSDYAIVSAPEISGADQARYEASIGAGFLVMPVGSLSMNHSETATYGGIKTKVTSMNYSRGLSRTTSLFLNASETRQSSAIYSVFVGLNFNFENNLRGAAQYNITRGANTETVQIQSDVPVGEGMGYRAAISRNETGSTSATSFTPFLQYNAQFGIYSVGSNIQNAAGRTTQTYNVSAAGSIVNAGGFFGLSRPVSDSFSIVMMDDVPGASVLNNGQEIGTTGITGRMVVPTLTSYGRNQITVDVKKIPIDYSISGVNQALSPPIWSGSCIAFDAIKMRAVTGTLSTRFEEKRTPLEYVEVSMQVGAKIVTFPTGKDGEFYLENRLPAEERSDGDRQSCRAIIERKKTGADYIRPGSYPAWVEIDGARCNFSIIFPETDDVINDVGELKCVMAGGK